MKKRSARPGLIAGIPVSYTHLLEGFVNQKTDFAYEVLIHDDASNDGTADIIREYARCV